MSIKTMSECNSDGGTESDEDQKTRLKISLASGNKKKYAELIDAGFHPPTQHSHALRSSRRKRRESSLSIDSIDLNDIESIQIEATSEIDSDNLSDVKPPASPPTTKKSNSTSGKSKVSSSLSSKAVTTGKVTKNQSDEQPFNLHHRLFEPIGGRAKRTVTRSINKSPNEQSRNRVKSDISRLSNDDKGEDAVVKSSSTSLVEQPPKVELPVNAVIRGSITHRVLLKVKRLDPQCLYDDPYCSCIESGYGEKEAAMERPSTAAEPVATTNNIALPDVVKEKRELGVCNDGLNVPLRVCVRSAILPQQSKRLPPEKYRVVILHGPHRGKKGMLMDFVLLSLRLKSFISDWFLTFLIMIP
jgi:6-pyruvoyl-tetrahydropterin synthase